MTRLSVLTSGAQAASPDVRRGQAPDIADAATRPRRRLGRADWLASPTGCWPPCRPFASPGHARITLPGAEGGYGRAVDGLEGFARTFLLAGFRIAGERGAGLDELADCYAAGIATGTDPTSPERWVRLDEHPQAKVEAASIALILDLTRPWIWDRLTPDVQERVVDYLSPGGRRRHLPADQLGLVPPRRADLPALGRRPVVGRRDGRATSPPTTRSPRADGWMSDGAERAYDHYVGWALHLYPTLWARMAGAADLAAAAARARRRDARPLPASTPSRWSAPTARR